MKERKILIIVIVILSLFLLYEIYIFINSKSNSSDSKEKEVVTPTPTITPTLIPTVTPTFVPTETPVITPEPTPIEIKEEIYNKIYLKYQNDKKEINPTLDNSTIFTIEGNNDSGRELYYEIILNGDNSSNYSYNKLKITLQEINDNEEIINNIDVERYNTFQNRIIHIGKIDSGSAISKKFKININCDDKSQYGDISVSVKISESKKELPIRASKTFLNSVNAHPNTTWNDPTDNVIYLSGTSKVINYNYVWYSGKLWRITAINPDGTLRLISESIMTTISWGINIEYAGSWVYQWLNEDFYDTLYNRTNLLVPNVKWNYTTDSNVPPKKPETLPNQKTLEAPVGLLSSYEYYNAYRNSSYSNNYLNISHYWWHITPQKNQAVRSTNDDGKQDLYDRDPGINSRGIRPVIYLNSYVEFTGSGSKGDPYRVVGDISTASNNTLINTRVSGEYVKFDNAIYRIVDTFDNKTKIQMVDYLRKDKRAMELHIARTIYYGKPSNTQNSEWWDYYLKNIWYPSISQNYRDMLVDGIYYIAKYPLKTSYKTTICNDANLDIVRVKNCNKYSDTDHIYVGKVGLIRIGEMFAAQQLDYELKPPSLWSITPFDDIENRIVHESNTLWHHKTWGGYHVVHPTLYLNSNVKIIGGTGLFDSPYEITL